MKAQGTSVTANLVWNLAGESLPVMAAVVAIPILVHGLGVDRFGILTLSWMIAGYFGLFDFGLGRALTKTMAQELSLKREAEAAKLFWTSFAMMLALGLVAGVALGAMTPWLTRSALKIPHALQGETRAGLFAIALGMPILVSISALRGALSAAERFDLLNLIRTPSGVLAFVAPLAILPLTHNLAWLIGILVLNRALAWATYLAATLHALPELRPLRIDATCAPRLIGFGAWITVSSVITPIMLYLDRFFIGASLSMAALTTYSVPMEIVAKLFIVPAAISGVMFPAFARSFTGVQIAAGAMFVRSLKLVALILFPLCAGLSAFAPQIMALWMGEGFGPESATILQILIVGAFVTGLSWIALVVLHGAHRPDLAAKIHLIDFPLYALVMWLAVRRFGTLGAAVTWSGRLVAENLVIFTMAVRFVKVSRREIVGTLASMGLAIALIAMAAMLPELRGRIFAVLAMLVASGGLAWRFLLDNRERAYVVRLVPSMLRPEPEKS